MSAGSIRRGNGRKPALEKGTVSPRAFSCPHSLIPQLLAGTFPTANEQEVSCELDDLTSSMTGGCVSKLTALASQPTMPADQRCLLLRSPGPGRSEPSIAVTRTGGHTHTHHTHPHTDTHHTHTHTRDVTAHLLCVRELPRAHALDVLTHAALVGGAGDDHDSTLGVPLQQHLRPGDHDALGLFGSSLFESFPNTGGFLNTGFINTG